MSTYDPLDATQGHAVGPWRARYAASAEEYAQLRAHRVKIVNFKRCPRSFDRDRDSALAGFG